jgi:hypothetical protein
MFKISHTSFATVLLGLFVFQSSLLAVPIRFLPWDDSVAARKLGLLGAKGVAEIKDLHPDKRTPLMDGTAGEAPLQIVALDRTSPDGKPVTVEVKSIAGMQAPLVLILPDPKHPSGLRPFVIEDNATTFRWGSIRFLNATGKALLVRQDKLIKALPETWTPVDVDPGGIARNIGVQMAASDKLKDILYSAVWEHHPDVRKLVFIIPGANVSTGAVDLKVIPEDRRTIAPATSETTIDSSN